MKKSRIFGFLNLKYVPFLIVLNPTSRCNLRCDYCDIKDNKTNYSLNWESLKRIAEDCNSLKVPMITVSGGEPLLNQHLLRFAKYAHNKNIVLNLNTNGTLFTENNVKEYAKYFDFIRVSLDGDEETHDKITGVRGSYSKVVDSLNLFFKLKRKNAKIGINFTFSKQNQNRIDYVVEKFRKKVDFISVVPQFRFVCNNLKNDVIKPEGISMKKFAFSSEGLLNRAELKNNIKNCDAGILYMAIAANGSILFCPFSNPYFDPLFIQGNIENDSLKNIWLKDKLDYDMGSVNKELKKRGYDNEEISRIMKNNFVKNERFINICNGCHATCTTEVSNIFRRSPLSLALNGFGYLRRYRML